MAHPPALRFDDLTLGYDGHPAVHHLSGAVARGALLAVVGANGSGKSTLLKGIVGILKPLAGSVSRGPDSRFAYLPQQSELDRTFPARVVDLVRMGLWPARGLFGRFRAEDHARVDAALDAVGLRGFNDRGIDTLSGGQLQRALFARVAVQDAPLILLDEPFNAVDEKTVADLVALLHRWHGEGRTIMVVAHDLELVARHFPETLLLARRAVAWGPTQTVLSPENRREARRFSEAWDETAPWCETHAHAPHLHAVDGGHDHGHHHDHTRRPDAA